MYIKWVWLPFLELLFEKTPALNMHFYTDNALHQLHTNLTCTLSPKHSQLVLAIENSSDGLNMCYDDNLLQASKATVVNIANDFLYVCAPVLHVHVHVCHCYIGILLPAFWCVSYPRTIIAPRFLMKLN